MTGSFGDVVRGYLNIMVRRPFCSGILFLHVWREAKAEFPFFPFFPPFFLASLEYTQDVSTIQWGWPF